MKQHKIEKQTVEIDKVNLDKIICDKCKKEIEIIEREYENFAGVSLSISAGYGSRYDFDLSDGNANFEICDDCFGELLNALTKE